jgi:hypothetical protein
MSKHVAEKSSLIVGSYALYRGAYVNRQTGKTSWIVNDGEYEVVVAPTREKAIEQTQVLITELENVIKALRDMPDKP